MCDGPNVGRLDLAATHQELKSKTPHVLAFNARYAFEACAGVTTLHLPSSLVSIGEDAFRGCAGIAALHLPSSLATIGDSAFEDCAGLTCVCLPEGLRSLGAAVFAGCVGIRRVLAPDTLARDIRSLEVFGGCPALAAAGGITWHSEVPRLRRHFWHPTMHTWCTPGGQECVLAVLVAELRLDARAAAADAEAAGAEAAAAAGFGAASGAGGAPAPALPTLPTLPHDLWLLLIEFAPRHTLGVPPR